VEIKAAGLLYAAWLKIFLIKVIYTRQNPVQMAEEFIRQFFRRDYSY
jgi:hypothetical protein